MSTAWMNESRRTVRLTQPIRGSHITDTSCANTLLLALEAEVRRAVALMSVTFINRDFWVGEIVGASGEHAKSSREILAQPQGQN
ncbi:hypothetical protein FQA47_023692 [Oryzias melastigma]|uniref:Uncharacterized protein n=1 Tax=Oryzias melastigma TaxID=30732 RepID=A0A834FPG4_ORYME|nr:hypothetical protein FQA47_023692 [Oryzias melastigma]